MKPNFTFFDDFLGYTGSLLPREFTIPSGSARYSRGDPDGILQLLTPAVPGSGILQANENFVFRQPQLPRTLALETRLRMRAIGTAASIEFGVASTVGTRVPANAKFWCDNLNWRALVNAGASRQGKNVVLAPFDFSKEAWTVLRLQLSTSAIEFFVNDQLLAEFVPRRPRPGPQTQVVCALPDQSQIWRPYIAHANDSVSIMQLDVDYLVIEET